MTAYTCANMDKAACSNCCTNSAAGTFVCAGILMDTALRAVSIFLIGIILVVGM